MTTNLDKAAQAAERTLDAYSSDRYADWTEAALAVLELVGERVEESADEDTERTEAILRSKFARWAADHSGEALGSVSGDALRRFLEPRMNSQVWPFLVQEGLA